MVIILTQGLSDLSSCSKVHNMNLQEAARIEAEANGRWMIVRVNKTEYMFYPDMIPEYRDGNDCYIYGDMVNPKRNCTNITRWFKVSNATFVRYEDK